MEDRHRLLIVSHGHPDLSPGGAQHAAYALFDELKDRPGVKAVFLGRHAPERNIESALSQHSADGREVLIGSNVEPFRFSQRDHRLLSREFRALLEWHRPTIVHFHHYEHLGIEMLREVRNYSPTVPIVMTLHEYLAICHHNGQMIKTESDELCRQASPQACNGCFPAISPQDFFLRELYLKSFLSLVDAFISPSQFLIDRYIAWGLPREKFVFLENGLSTSAHSVDRMADPDRLGRRLAFFGQMNRYKGLHVLLDAMAMLPKELRSGPGAVTLDLHGAHLSEQGEDYQRLIAKKLSSLRRSVKMHGRYQPEDLPSIMRDVGWVVVPSIWWENSPLVIQEAFANGLPVICSGIGGMAEKVRDGVNGLHFRVGDARSLADKIVEAATTPGLWQRLRTGIPPVETTGRVADRHLQIYDRLSSAAELAASSQVS